ncbi:accessory factor UbiK family protein [Anaplasma bovis]|uniref:accessory factor UbiK family protein n=1 Tax=Anaplasma bovis TaxID=186733 RepID=UPI002FF298D9
MFSSLLRDCARLSISALSTASSVLASGKQVFKRRVESWFSDMGFVSREEFDALRECLARSQSKTTRAKKDTKHG